MNVEVKSFARFREHFGESVLLDLPEGTTIAGALLKLADSASSESGILFSSPGILHSYIIVMINRERIDTCDAASRVLDDGDVVVVYPPVSGG